MNFQFNFYFLSISCYIDNDINGDVLLELDHEILKELKIRSIGERVRILLAVKALLKCCAGNTVPYVNPIKYYIPRVFIIYNYQFFSLFFFLYINNRIFS